MQEHRGGRQTASTNHAKLSSVWGPPYSCPVLSSFVKSSVFLYSLQILFAINGWAHSNHRITYERQYNVHVHVHVYMYEAAQVDIPTTNNNKNWLYTVRVRVPTRIICQLVLLTNRNHANSYIICFKET